MVGRRYRNRRIGEFFKELKFTEGRCTGIPKILKALKDNGSPPPVFETDEERTYFISTLRIHPEIHQGVEVNKHVTKQVSEHGVKILELCKTKRSRKEMLKHIELTNHPDNYKRHIIPLINEGYLQLSDPDKPKSSKQMYSITEKGRNLLKNNI